MSCCLLSDWRYHSSHSNISAFSFWWAHKGSVLPFWLHSEFNFLNKGGLFSYFAPDITISRYCMSSIKSKPSKQLLIACQTKRLVDAVWMTFRPQFTASKALFSREFVGFDELKATSGCFFYLLQNEQKSEAVERCGFKREWKTEKQRFQGGVLSSQWRCLFTYNPWAVQALRWRKTWILGGYWRKQKGFWCLLSFGLMWI